MKILILSDDFPPKSFGGAGIIAFSQAKELSRRGHEVVVITATGDKKEEGKIAYEGLNLYRIYSKYPAQLRSYFSIYNPQTARKAEAIISAEKPDIVHAHNLHQYLSYSLLKIAKKHAKAVFLTAHDAMMVHYSKVYPRESYKISGWEQLRYFWREWNPFRNFLIKRYLKNVDKIFSVSSALAEVLRQNGINKIEVLHNGINLEEFRTNEKEISEFKDKHGLNGKKVMFFGGRLGRAKGGDIAVRLLREVNKTIPEAVLLVAGRVDESMKKERNIVFTGWLDRSVMPAAYSASDAVLVLSTYIDPFPTVNLEAMVAGKPVIGTRFGGTPEAVTDGVTGFVVDPNNIEEVTEKTLKLLGNKALAEKFGRAGRDRVKTEFDLGRSVDKLERIYAQTL